jgi:hypothetical protein
MAKAHTSPGGAATSYAWKPHARLKGDAQKVGELLENVRAENGTLSPALVVDLARHKDSILHPYFEWEDSTAAEMYRQQQAAHILRSIVAVTCRAVPTLTAPTRAFVSIRAARQESESEETAGSYTSISEAIRVVDYRQQLMEQATRDLDAYRVKYALLSDLTGWGAALHAARRALEKALEAGKNRSKEKAEAAGE